MPKNAKNVDMNEFNIDNYDKFINNVPHRGVLIYVHKRVNATMMTVESKYDEFIEYTMCEIKTLNTGVNLLFVCVYRSPNSNPDNNANLLNLLTGIDKHPAKLKRTLSPYFRNLPLLHITIRLHLTSRLLKFMQWLARKQYVLVVGNAI